jgi:hypothetical protein
MSEPHTSEPTALRAGDAVSWTRDLPEHLPTDGWTLKYRLLWPTAPHVAFTAAGYNALHLVALTSADTAAWRAGIATLVGWVEKGTARVTMLQAQIQILPDLTAATSLDGRSQNARALADARAALAAYTASDRAMVEEYQILGRRMKFRDIQQLRDLIAHYEQQVAREAADVAAAHGLSPGRIHTRF